jgi:16S rRNA (cytosine1402-N4)-methyltransferase
MWTVFCSTSVFSFMRDGPLNMRMDGSDSGTAELAVNEWSEAKLGQTIRDYGEERHWKSIARRIVERRMERRITTTQELVRAIGGKNIPGKKHPATKTFQALRIAVNGELEAVEAVIPDAIELLRPGGRLAIITFHSLEDRLVKWAFRKAAGMRTREEEDDPMTAMLNMSEVAREKKVKLVTRKPIKPSAEEMAANPRARSSKLRVIERL